MRRWLLVFAWLGVSLVVCAQQPAPVGRPAPGLDRPDLDGRSVSIAGLRGDGARGKVVLVNFWASWCGPCLTEMPRFALWRREHPDDLAVAGVSMDDEPETARRIRRKLGIDYPMVMATPELATAWGGVLGLPVTFLVDRQGQVRARIEGETDLDKLEARVRELMAER